MAKTKTPPDYMPLELAVRKHLNRFPRMIEFTVLEQRLFPDDTSTVNVHYRADVPGSVVLEGRLAIPLAVFAKEILRESDEQHPGEAETKSLANLRKLAFKKHGGIQLKE